MTTLAQFKTRIERNIGLFGAVPTTDIQGCILDSLNDALMGIARKRKWYWWLTQDITTLAGLSAANEASDLPSDCGHIECILDSDKAVLYPKTPHRQLQYPKGIGESTSRQTYAMGGINSATGVKTILWSPALLSAGDYTLWYYRLPTLLSSDTDEPDLPAEFHDYLFWNAMQFMLLAEEERASLIDRCKLEALEIYKSMEHDHARNIETLTRRIVATA
jgi:hypothetical protein